MAIVSVCNEHLCAHVRILSYNILSNVLTCKIEEKAIALRQR